MRMLMLTGEFELWKRHNRLYLLLPRTSNHTLDDLKRNFRHVDYL